MGKLGLDKSRDMAIHLRELSNIMFYSLYQVELTHNLFRDTQFRIRRKQVPVVIFSIDARFFIK